MSQYRRIGSTRVLWGLLLLAIAYGSLGHYLRTLTGSSVLDGALGIILGLYICSHPAANAVDFLFLERGLSRRNSPAWGDLPWLALNVLVMLIGWLLIVVGATRFVR
jgi:hypothetical protein